MEKPKHYFVINGNCFWLNGDAALGLDWMTAPLDQDGRVLWDDGGEVDSRADQAYLEALGRTQSPWTQITSNFDLAEIVTDYEMLKEYVNKAIGLDLAKIQPGAASPVIVQFELNGMYFYVGTDYRDGKTTQMEVSWPKGHANEYESASYATFHGVGSDWATDVFKYWVLQSIQKVLTGGADSLDTKY